VTLLNVLVSIFFDFVEDLWLVVPFDVMEVVLRDSEHPLSLRWEWILELVKRVDDLGVRQYNVVLNAVVQHSDTVLKRGYARFFHVIVAIRIADLVGILIFEHP
jgi:hypothetical protein